MVTANAIIRQTSFLIKDQVPGFVRDDHPQFISFLERYYEHLQSANTGIYDSVSNTYFMGPVYFSKNALEYVDLDTADFERFLDGFKKEFSPNIPKQLDSVVDTSTFYKNILDFYRAKGTENSFKLLFRLLYNEEIELYYPNRDILTVSGGSFSPEVRIRLGTTDNIEDIVGRRIYGATSGVYATVERIERTYDNIQFPWRDPADRDDGITFVYLNKFSIGNTTVTQTEFDIGELIYTGNVTGNHVNTIIHASPTKAVFYDDFSGYANANYFLAPSDNRGSLTDSIERPNGEYSLVNSISTITGSYGSRWYDRWSKRGANVYSYVPYGASNNYVNPAISFIEDVSASGGKVLVVGNEGTTHGPILNGSLGKEDRVNLIHNDNILIDKNKLYRFSVRVKDPHSDNFDLNYRYGEALQFNSGYSALGSDGESYIKSGYIHPGDHFILSSEYPSGAMSANGADLTGNNPSWTTDWRVFQSYATGSGAGQLAGHGNVMEFSNTAASNFEYPRRVFSYPNETASFGADTTYIRPIIDVEHTHNYVHRAYSVFDAPVSSYEIEESPSASNTYPIHIHGPSYGGGWRGYINTISSLITACTDGFSTANSFEVELIDDLSTQSAWPKATVFANAHIYTRSAFVSNTTYNKDAPFIIQIPKGKRWVLSYYASTNNHTQTECRMEVWFKDSTQPSSNIFMITDGAPTNSADAGYFHATDAWERRHLVFNFANTTSPILGDGTTDDTNVTLVEHYDQGPNSFSSFVGGGGGLRFAKDRTSSDGAADPWSGDTYAANVDTILLKLASANSSGAYGTVSVRVAGIQLEEAANNTTVNASPFRSQGDDSGGSQIYVDYYKIEEMGTIEPLTDAPQYLDESSHLSTKSAVMQDNYYYQQYAYDIRSQQDFKDYTSIVEAAVHPAGFKRFGTKVVYPDDVGPGTSGTAGYKMAPDEEGGGDDESGVAMKTSFISNQDDPFTPYSVNSLAGWWSADAISPMHIDYRKFSSDSTANGLWGSTRNRMVTGLIPWGPVLPSGVWANDSWLHTGDRFATSNPGVFGGPASGLLANLVVEKTALKGGISGLNLPGPLGNSLRLTEMHDSVGFLRMWGHTDTFTGFEYANKDMFLDDHHFYQVLEPYKKWLVSCYAMTSNVLSDTSENSILIRFSLANTTGFDVASAGGDGIVQGNMTLFTEENKWERLSTVIDLSSLPHTRSSMIIQMADRTSHADAGLTTGNTVYHIEGMMIEEYDPVIHGTDPNLTPSPYIAPGVSAANVYMWMDKSINEHHLFANTHKGLYYPPQYVANSANGYPALRFAANTVKNDANVYAYSSIGGTVNSIALDHGDSTARKLPTSGLQALTNLSNTALPRPVSNAWTIFAVAKTNLAVNSTSYDTTLNPTIFNSGYGGNRDTNVLVPNKARATMHLGYDVVGETGAIVTNIAGGNEELAQRDVMAQANTIEVTHLGVMGSDWSGLSSANTSSSFRIIGMSIQASQHDGTGDLLNFHLDGRRFSNSVIGFTEDFSTVHLSRAALVEEDQRPFVTSIGKWKPVKTGLFPFPVYPEANGIMGVGATGNIVFDVGVSNTNIPPHTEEVPNQGEIWVRNEGGIDFVSPNGSIIPIVDGDFGVPAGYSASHSRMYTPYEYGTGSTVGFGVTPIIGTGSESYIMYSNMNAAARFGVATGEAHSTAFGFNEHFVPVEWDSANNSWYVIYNGKTITPAPYTGTFGVPFIPDAANGDFIVARFTRDSLLAWFTDTFESFVFANNADTAGYTNAVTAVVGRFHFDPPGTGYQTQFVHQTREVKVLSTNNFVSDSYRDLVTGTADWDGDIAEVLVFNEKLANTEIAKVEGYLAWKYGLRENLIGKDGLDFHPYRFEVPLAAGGIANSFFADY